MGTVDRPLPPTHFWNPNTRRASSVGGMSALYANSPNIEPRVRLSWIFPSYAYLRKASCQLLAKRMGGGGERTGLVVRASDSGSGDPGSILGRVGVLFP